MECPACSGEGKIEGSVYRCTVCDGVFGYYLHKSDVEQHVFFRFAKNEVEPGKLRYFDFTLLNGDRVHGWYDPETKLVHQFG